MSDAGVSTTIQAAVTGAPAAAKETPATKEGAKPEASQPTRPKLTHDQRRVQAWNKALAEEKTEKPAEEAEATEETKTEEGKPAETAAKPKEQTPQEKADAKAFAALAREKSELVTLRETVAQERKEAQASVAAMKTERDDAVKRAAEAEGRVEKIIGDPDAFFAHAFDKLGIKTKEDLQRYAARAWQRLANSQQKPEDKPLTEAEVKKLWDEREAKAKQDATAKDVYDRYDKLFEIPDEGEAKYPAATYGWSRDERIREGDKIANALQAIGRKPTLEEIADAVDEAAKADPVVQKKLKKLGISASGKPAEAPKPAPKPEKTVTAPAPAAKPAPKPAPTNGAARMSHKDRVAAALAAVRKEP